MKRLAFLFCLALAASGLSAQGVRFVACSFEEAKSLASREEKLIFVDVYTSWCGPCRRMSREVFPDETVASYFNANYICLKLDAENECGHGFFEAYTPSAYPSFYWLTSEGELLDSRSGFMDAAALLEAAAHAESSTLGIRLKALQQRWNDGERSEALLEEYLFEVLPQVDPAGVRPLLNDYLCGLPADSLASRTVGEMIRGYSRTLTDDKLCRTLLEYSDRYRQYFGKRDFDRTMYMLLVRIPMADRRVDAARYAQDRDLIGRLAFPHKEMYVTLLDMEERLLDGAYAEAMAAALPALQRYEQDFPYLYAELCYTLIITGFFEAEYTPSEQECALCLELASRAFRLTPSQSTLAYLSAAHARTGDYRRAYELSMYLPFYGEPVLSNAVYGLMNLKRPE